MFRELKRMEQTLTENEMISILNSCQTGVMAVNGDDGYPYAVPLNYVYENGRILFHCALDGHKVDAIKKNPKVSFCVIESDDVDARALNTDYKSVIVFGKAGIIDGNEDRMAALMTIGAKYSAEFEEEVKREIKNEWDNVALVEIVLDHMSGKKGSGVA